METPLVNLPGLLPNSGNVFPRRSFLAQESSSNFDESQYQLAERSCSSQHKHVWLSIQLNVCGDGDHGAGRSGTGSIALVNMSQKTAFSMSIDHSAGPQQRCKNALQTRLAANKRLGIRSWTQWIPVAAKAKRPDRHAIAW